MKGVSSAWDRWWFAPAWATDLAVCRALFCFGVLALYGGLGLPLWAEVGPEFARPIKVLGLVSFAPLPGPWLEAAWGVWRLALVTAGLGLATRLSTAVAFGLGFYLLALPHHFGRLEHTDGVVVLLLGVLAASRCGDAWSVDAWLGRRWGGDARRGKAEASGAYRWPVRMAQLVLSAVFCCAGLSKVINGGWAWVTSDTLATVLVKAQLRPAGFGPIVDWGAWLAQHKTLMVLSAAGTIVVELGYPVALFSRRARWVWLPGMVGLLIGIRLLIGPWFGSFMLAHVFWVPWSRWWGRPDVLPAGVGPSASSAPAPEPTAGGGP